MGLPPNLKLPSPGAGHFAAYSIRAPRLRGGYSVLAAAIFFSAELLSLELVSWFFWILGFMPTCKLNTDYRTHSHRTIGNKPKFPFSIYVFVTRNCIHDRSVISNESTLNYLALQLWGSGSSRQEDRLCLMKRENFEIFAKKGSTKRQKWTKSLAQSSDIK